MFANLFHRTVLGFGENWRINFGYELHISGGVGDGASLHMPDGSAIRYFRNSAGEMEIPAHIAFINLIRQRKLRFVGTWPANLNDVNITSTQWELTDENDVIWRLQTFSNDYNIARLVKMIDRSGYEIDVTYGANGEMQTATDSYGRQFAFSWNSHVTDAGTFVDSLARIDLPDGTSLRYLYDSGASGGQSVSDMASVRLIEAGRYSASDDLLDKETYRYDDLRFPYHVTEVRNLSNVAVNVVAYDGRGRASESGLAGGVDRSTLTYGDLNAEKVERTVTNALGKTAIYRFKRNQESDSAAFLLVGVDGEPSANCPASARSMTYAAGPFGLEVGLPVTETDEEGRVTAYTRDSRDLPQTIRRGSGTPGAVTTVVTWHPTLLVPTRIVDPGRTTDIVWTGGNVTSVTQTDTTTHTVPYSTSGQTRSWGFGYSGALLTSVDGPLAGTSDTTSYTYGTDGYLRTITNPVGHVTTVTAVNGRGQPTSITDPNGVVTAIAYDDMGHVTSITNDQAGTPATTSFTYDANWNVASIARPGGAVLTLTWDDASRLTKIANAAGESITYTLDKLGGAAKIEVRQGSTITAERAQTFDELGRIIKTIKGDASAEWGFGYDKTDNLVRVTDPRSQNWASGFDALDRLVSQTEPGAATTSVTRNGIDEIATYKDPRNLTTTYVRNGFGDVIRETNPDSGVTDYEYDARGLLTKKTRATGQVETFLYDAAGRMTRRAYAGSTLYDVDYTWDGTAGGSKGKGRITRVDDHAGYSTFTYDARGNVLTETRVNTGSPGSTTHLTQYRWDLADRLTRIIYPSGRYVIYVRDAMGRVTSVTTRANASSSAVTLASNIAWRPMAGTLAALTPPGMPDLELGLVARNAMPVTDGSAMNAGTAAQNNPLPGEAALTTDLLQSLTYGNGLIYSKQYDEDNRLERWTVEQGATSVVRRKSISADGMNVTRLEDELTASLTQDFTYSASARLASASGGYGTRAWTYDKVGNRVTETKNGVASTWSYPSTSNRLSLVKEGSTTRRSFGYDGEGAITGDARTPGGVHAYAYHPTGMLAQVKIGGVTQATYTYDGFNRLTTRTVLAGSPTGTVRHVWDIFGHIIAEAPYGGLGAREYVWLGDLALAVFDGTVSPATQAYVHVDHLDRPVAMTDASKAATWSAAYEPFGKVASVTGSATQNLGLPGQWFQIEAGLAYNWNRHYDPSLGRYTRPDPLGFVDGPSVYGYAGQSPGMRVDPGGLQTSVICIFGGPANPGCLPGLANDIVRACTIVLGIGGTVEMSRSRTGTCSCQHRDIFSSGGKSCQALRESGACGGPYKGSGTDSASCQANARSNAPNACQGCLGHCLFRRED